MFLFLGMIPTVLLSLINKYNEPGIFINVHKKIYWFNGKRTEFWVQVHGFSEFRIIQNNCNLLKIQTFSRFTHVFLHREFVASQDCPSAYQLEVNFKNVHYGITNGQFRIQHRNAINKLHINSGRHMFAFQNHIYVFGHRNEKYNIQENMWYEFIGFAKFPRYFYFNERFYMIYDHGKLIREYDPIRDIWSINKTQIK